MLQKATKFQLCDIKINFVTYHKVIVWSLLSSKMKVMIFNSFLEI